MLDDLRRTLSRPAAWLTLVGAWVLAGSAPLVWTRLVLIAIAVPALIPTSLELLPHRGRVLQAQPLADGGPERAARRCPDPARRRAPGAPDVADDRRHRAHPHPARGDAPASARVGDRGPEPGRHHPRSCRRLSPDGEHPVHAWRRGAPRGPAPARELDTRAAVHRPVGRLADPRLVDQPSPRVEPSERLSEAETLLLRARRGAPGASSRRSWGPRTITSSRQLPGGPVRSWRIARRPPTSACPSCLPCRPRFRLARCGRPDSAQGDLGGLGRWSGSGDTSTTVRHTDLAPLGRATSPRSTAATWPDICWRSRARAAISWPVLCGNPSPAAARRRARARSRGRGAPCRRPAHPDGEPCPSRRAIGDVTLGLADSPLGRERGVPTSVPPDARRHAGGCRASPDRGARATLSTPTSSTGRGRCEPPSRACAGSDAFHRGRPSSRPPPRPCFSRRAPRRCGGRSTRT